MVERASFFQSFSSLFTKSLLYFLQYNTLYLYLASCIRIAVVLLAAMHVWQAFLITTVSMTSFYFIPLLYISLMSLWRSGILWMRCAVGVAVFVAWSIFE